MRDRYGVDLTRLFEEHLVNAILAWAGCGLLVGIGVAELARGDLTWGGLVLSVAVLSILPGAFYRSLRTTLPWELIALVTAAVGWRSVAPASEAALYAVIAGAALLITAELHLFTPSRMSHRFVVALVAVATAAVAGAWALISWTADQYLGTGYITTNAELMWDLGAASATGLLAGVVFDLYVRWWEARVDRLTPLLADEAGDPPPGDDSSRSVVDRTLEFPGRDRTRAARAMQALMVVAVVIGALERNVDVLLNAFGGLAVTFVPALLERDSRVPMDAGLSVWLTTAVFLHVIGTVGIPGVPGNLYSDLPWWDHLTHAASASLVAGIGYALLRAIDEHSDGMALPTELTFAFTLLFVLAFGVYWEIFEFALGHVRIGGESALTQYGVEDTLQDLAFDAGGGLIAAVLGEIYLIGTGAEGESSTEAS